MIRNQLTKNLSDVLYHFYRYTLVALFSLSIIVEKGKDVLWINGHHTFLLDNLFRMITNLGDGLIFIPVIIIALFIRYEYAIMGVIISLCHGLLVSLFKHVLFPNLMRPKNVIDNDLLHFVPGVDVHSAHSFPSGHTTTAFCAALFIALISRNNTAGFVVLLAALLVGYSRIYLLQHFLIDVAAGAVMGCFITYVVWVSFSSFNKPAWMNARLELPVKRSSHKEKMA